SKGVDPARVVAETESRNTEENLRFSRKLLTDPSAQVVVATSSYHVFRAALLTRTLGMRAHVVGARTAWFYFPSALLREFVGIIRDRLWFTVLSVAVLIVFAISCTAVIVPAVVAAVGHTSDVAGTLSAWRAGRAPEARGAADYMTASKGPRRKNRNRTAAKTMGMRMKPRSKNHR